MKVRTAISILKHANRRKDPKRAAQRPPEKVRKMFFFRDGWGDETVLSEATSFEVFSPKPGKIFLELTPRKSPHGLAFDGSFDSPLRQPWLAEESRRAKVRVILPPQAKREKVPLCICFPMTGDEGFSIRTRTFAAPLVGKGIGVVMLENPYYGSRRRKGQENYFLTRVQDMLVMCIAAVEEGRALVDWAHREGHTQIGVAGVSQGGMIAAAVGALSEIPLAVAISLAAHSPDVILTEGFLRNFVDWAALGDDQHAAAKRLRDIFKIGDLTQMPKPRAPRASFILGAKRDLVVPKYSVEKIHKSWKGSQIKWLPGTHLSSIALHEKAFRNVTLKAFHSLAGD